MKLSPSLLLSGLAAELVTLVLWATGGFHTGWTRNRIEVREEDPITGLEAIRYEETFIMGVELLALGLVIGSVLMFAGIFLRRKESKA